VPRFVAAAVVAVCLVSTGYWWTGQTQSFSADAQTRSLNSSPHPRLLCRPLEARQYHRSNPMQPLTPPNEGTAYP